VELHALNGPALALTLAEGTTGNVPSCACIATPMLVAHLLIGRSGLDAHLLEDIVVAVERLGGQVEAQHTWKSLSSRSAASQA
jgi:hypothetical protein